MGSRNAPRYRMFSVWSVISNFVNESNVSGNFLSRECILKLRKGKCSVLACSLGGGKSLMSFMS